MMVHIIGVDHWLQEYELVADGEYSMGEPTEAELAYRRNSKEMFYEIVESHIQNGDFTVLGEECRPLQDTIGRRLAAENSIHYLEIDMLKNERAASGILPNYQDSLEEAIRGIKLREEHMVQKLAAYLGRTNVLVICGANHIDGLTRLFSEKELSVTSQDVSKEEWAQSPIEKAVGRGF